MKTTRKGTFLLLVVCMAVMMSSAAFAKDVYKAIALAQNKTVKQRGTDYKYNSGTGETTYTYYRYKVTVPSEGYLTMKVGQGSGIGSIWLNVYKKVNASSIIGHWSTSKKAETLTIPVSKGTYYFKLDEEGQTMSYKFTKVVQKANYSVGKALALKKNAKAVVCQTPQYNYSRWFKLQLTKKQAISFWFDDQNRVRLYDADLNQVEIEHAGSSSPKYFSKEKLPKGTYYLRVSSLYYYDYYRLNNYYTGTLYWK